MLMSKRILFFKVKFRVQGLIVIWINRQLRQGSTFPGAWGHMPLDFAVGPRLFSVGAQNSMKDNQKSCF